MSLLLKAGDTLRSAPIALLRAPVTSRSPSVSTAPGRQSSAHRPGSGRRNVAIDVLRGYCILMMVTSHTATQSYVNNSVHLLRFVSGAEGFVFLAGLVLGMVYRRKLDAAPARQAYQAIWKRAGMLWAVHCVLTIAAVILNPLLFHYADIPDVHGIAPWRIAWLTATLQLQPGHMLNILPLYVFLLGAAPLCFELVRRGKSAWVLAGSAAIFVYTQFEPGAGRWVAPISGGEAFPPLAWQFLFVPGLVIGYHSALIRSTILGPHRRRIMWALAAACVAMVVLVSVQTANFQFYNHEAWDLFLWERHPLRFGRVLYFFLAIATFYLLAQAWLSAAHRLKLPRFPLDLLATLGRNSLYAFLVHLAFAFGFGLLQIPPERWLLLEAVPVASVFGIYVMARYQVARRWIPN
jgi:hypothetical protein